MATISIDTLRQGVHTAKIDYLSFTLPGGVGQGELNDAVWNGVAGRIVERVKGGSDVLSMGKWEKGAGVRHYAYSMRATDIGANVYFGGSANHVLVQFSGVCCSLMTRDYDIRQLAVDCHERMTRLDIAVDIEIPDVSPEQFIKAGYSGRFKSDGHINKPSGKTQYVGSRNSQRYARVYRYAKPHPRNGFLRIEYELKGDYAKRAALALKTSNVSSLAKTMGEAFAWKSKVYNGDLLGDSATLTSRSEKEGSSSVLWVLKQVQPALIRLHNAGIYDVREWYERAILPNLK